MHCGGEDGPRRQREDEALEPRSNLLAERRRKQRRRECLVEEGVPVMSDISMVEEARAEKRTHRALGAV